MAQRTKPISRHSMLVAGLVAGLGLMTVRTASGNAYLPAAHLGDSLGQGFIDEAITAKVKARLATRQSLGTSTIMVSVLNGVVTLSGTAADSIAKTTAARDALSVEAVKRVDNRLILLKTLPAKR